MSRVEIEALPAQDVIVMANANRCTVHPKHLLVNQGRVEELFGDLYRCACGESRLANTDEARARGERQ